MTSYVVSTPVNGTFTVPDDLINTSQTSLNLIGRGVTNYGQAVAENDINLLSSFAGPTAPNVPLLGQLWYNSNLNQLNVLTAPGTWSAFAFESELANYATQSEMDNLSAAVNLLGQNAVTKDQLPNYVTTTELYTPQVGARVVPYKSGGTGLNVLGNPGQILAVNGLQTGLTYVNPQTYYKRPFVSVSATTTLAETIVGSIINVTTSGITVNLPGAVRCPQGTSFIFTMLVTGGSITISAFGTDTILANKASQAKTFTMSAGEELEIVSDGALGWVMSSYSRTTAVTMPAGDSSTSIANTAFVTSALASANSGLLNYVNTTFAPINSPTFTGAPRTPTAGTGDASTLLANTAFVNTAVTNGINSVRLPFTPVQQGGGISQLTNKVYIGWSSNGLLVTVDNTALGRVLFDSDYNVIEGQVNNLQAQINSKAAGGQPYAYTGINQTVSFWDITAGGTIYSNNDIWAFASDTRLKENIRPIKNALFKINQLTGVLYNFTEEASKLIGIESSRQHMGLLAQEVQKIAPEIVGPAPFDTDKKTGKSISGENYLTVQYEKAVPLLLEGIKELDAKFEEILTKLNRLLGDD